MFYNSVNVRFSLYNCCNELSQGLLFFRSCETLWSMITFCILEAFSFSLSFGLFISNTSLCHKSCLCTPTCYVKWEYIDIDTHPFAVIILIGFPSRLRSCGIRLGVFFYFFLSWNEKWPMLLSASSYIFLTNNLHRYKLTVTV